MIGHSELLDTRKAIEHEMQLIDFNEGGYIIPAFIAALDDKLHSILELNREAGTTLVLVTHDEGAVEALEPERILLLPDGVEDHWGQDYLDLISLA